jgi:branched-chain amino acid transport system substrate-binding protein
VLARIAVAALLLGSAIAPAAAQIRIGLMVSATGPTSAIGIPQKNTGDILPATIGGMRVDYISLEDGGDTTRAVQNVKKLISENRIDALIGPSTTPNAFAILDVIAEAKVPMMATVGTSAVVEPLDDKKRWVFKTTQNDDLIAAALLKHMTKKGVRTVGFIGFNDPYGENWLKVFSALGEKAGVKVAAIERYARNDSSVTGQTLKLIAARPDAVLVAAVGGPAVLPQATLREQGFKGTIYQTHAVATDDFIKLGKDKVESTVLAAGPMLVIDEIPDTNPTKKVAQAYIAAYEKQFGTKPATFGANTWDAGLLLERAIPVALKSAAPTSTASGFAAISFATCPVTDASERV